MKGVLLKREHGFHGFLKTMFYVFVFKMTILSEFFGDLMTYIIRECAGKK